MTDSDPNTPQIPTSAMDANNVVPLTPAKAEPTPREKVVGFVKKHPVITVASGLVLGAAASALLPRKAGRKLAGRAIKLAETAGAATAMFGRETSEKAQELGADARESAGRLASSAEKATSATAAGIEKLALAAVAAVSAFGRAAAKKAEEVGEAAAEKGHEIVDMAGEIKKRAKR
ncbi:hypothetical protein [Novosphingobium pentaromativorans]|uniref:Uncharacterized protein n=1 Tax=Novosphingobium pentaromativorans US6-1 TaxID=1088721 RepID=G6E6Q9_9SPHN|nr:hypothetical protein [Novosphingobium pentaromativorans]AIT78442.1 hypothetical protein JI59_00675 [Novosphingobium pentaromativorans US6-1]EHJ62955.1 hypothetical protein NSU_0030 [Novosphingobium pentaromativorans US6-1]